MKFHKLLSGILICFCTTGLIAQTEDNLSKKRNKFALYAGVGPNIYFNNLVLAKKYVNESNYSFAGRLMWEPEHLLSLGVESGYYRMFTVDFDGQSDITISNSAIPIHLVVCMKFLKTFYFNFASGQTILLNNVSNYKNSEINTSVLSLGDFACSIGYRNQIMDRISLGGEIKYFYSSKLVDKNIALLFMAGFHF